MKWIDIKDVSKFPKWSINWEVFIIEKYSYAKRRYTDREYHNMSSEKLLIETEWGDYEVCDLCSVYKMDGEYEQYFVGKDCEIYKFGQVLKYMIIEP